MLASFSIVPVGSGDELKEYIARVLDLVDRSGLDYRAGAMQTTVEGDMEAVMELVMDCHKLMRKHASRVDSFRLGSFNASAAGDAPGRAGS